MAFTTLDGVIAKLPGQQRAVLKTSLTSKGAGSFHSLWTAPGLPTAGAVPGSVNGVISTSATMGALSIANAAGGSDLYLAKLAASITSAGTLMLYDRLWANSVLSGIVITAQSWTPPTLTRDITGEGVQAWLEVYTTLGATATTATLSYTNSQGVAGRSATASVVATSVAGQMIPFILAPGDTGVRTVASVTLTASTGTAGNFGITLLKNVATIPMSLANAGVTLDAFGLGLPIVEQNAALSLMLLCSGTATGTVIADLNIIEG